MVVPVVDERRRDRGGQSGAADPAGTHWSEVKPIELPGQERALPAPRAKKAKVIVPTRPATAMRGGLWFAPATTAIVEAKPKVEKKPIDPRLIAASRELRDRWLEQVNPSPTQVVGKYDVARQIAGADVVDGEVVTTRLLAA